MPKNNLTVLKPSWDRPGWKVHSLSVLYSRRKRRVSGDEYSLFTPCEASEAATLLENVVLSCLVNSPPNSAQRSICASVHTPWELLRRSKKHNSVKYIDLITDRTGQYPWTRCCDARWWGRAQDYFLGRRIRLQNDSRRRHCEAVEETRRWHLILRHYNI